MRTRRAGLTALAGVLLGASSLAVLAVRGAPEASSPCRYGPPRRVARLQDERVNECSGLAAGRRNPELFWAHNDSGDSARLFALDREGRTRAVLTVTGARARDWEDLAAGPGPDGTPCLFIGDIGNNSRQRTDLVVYCIPEPVLPAEATELASEPAVAYPFRYPGDSPDCEALLVHPQTGALYLIAKDTSGKPEVYRFPTPLQPDHPVTLERVGSLRLEAPSIMGRMVTGGDIAPDGKRLVLRTYLTVLEFRVPEGAAFEEAFRQRPEVLRGPMELQGEAVAYLPDGHGFLTLPEGKGAPMHLFPCITPGHTK